MNRTNAYFSSLKKNLTLLARLFWTFCCIGPSTFGGGYAMLPIIEREVVGKKKWVNEKEIGELISLAGSAPGGVGVNAAPMIGHRHTGKPVLPGLFRLCLA